MVFYTPFLLNIVVPLAYYFVVNENIYPSSDIYSIVASRMVCLYISLTQLSASHSLRTALAAVQTLQQPQKENPTKTMQTVISDRDQEMVQALQSTLRVLQNERARAAEVAARLAQAPGKKSERESTGSPVELKSPKARRRKSRPG